MVSRPLSQTAPCRCTFWPALPWRGAVDARGVVLVLRALAEPSAQDTGSAAPAHPRAPAALEMSTARLLLAVAQKAKVAASVHAGCRRNLRLTMMAVALVALEVAMPLGTSRGGYARSGGRVGGSGNGGGAGDDAGGSVLGHWRERCSLGDAGGIGGSAGDGDDAGVPPMSIARLMTIIAWVALVAASLLSVRRCGARSMLAVAIAWLFQWLRRCAPLGLALALQAVTWAAVKSKMLRAAAQETWRSGARWLTLGMPLLVTPPCLHVHVACL